MKMLKKDIITLIIILIFIIGINFFIDKIMDKVFNEILNLSKEILTKLEKEDDISNKEYIEKVYKIDDIWQTEEKYLSCFLEHDELEKVSKEIERLKTSSKNSVNEDVEEEIYQIQFLLNHIKSKNSLKVKNIF